MQLLSVLGGDVFLHRSKEMQHKGNAILTNFKREGGVLFFCCSESFLE